MLKLWSSAHDDLADAAELDQVHDLVHVGFQRLLVNVVVDAQLGTEEQRLNHARLGALQRTADLH